MNLFFNPTVSEFQKFISKIKGDNIVHDVVVDYDGEVLVDPHLEQPKLNLDKFKVRVRITPQSRKAIDKKPNMLWSLFNFLLTAWNNEQYEVHSFAW